MALKHKQHGIPPLAAAIAGLVLLPAIYFLIMLSFAPFQMAIEQFRERLPFIAVMSVLMSFQLWLYTNSRRILANRSAMVAGSAGFSGASMVACCAHHVTDLLPFLGLSALSGFLFKYQYVFLTAAVFINLFGITMMVRGLQEAHVRKTGSSVIDAMLGIDAAFAGKAVLMLLATSVMLAIGYTVRFG